MGIVGHDDGFKLGLREMALCDQAVWQAQPLGGLQGRHGWCDRGHRNALNQRRRVFLCTRNVDPLWAIAGIDLGYGGVFARRLERGERQRCRCVFRCFGSRCV